ncbi:hypothetical protein RN001_006621 [Aquatica leii]|uniref:Uncharacterized protein n=1 Tax=Aquatica leii TaxID=1421715 RepID=A0AAN7PDS4_9COLE|nr:hypothetical protein RN001_006621 [Aquatica leii]
MASKLNKTKDKRNIALVRLQETHTIALKAKIDSNVVPLFKAYCKRIENVYENFCDNHNQVIGLIPDDDNAFEEQDTVRAQADKMGIIMALAKTLTSEEELMTIMNEGEEPVMEVPVDGSLNHENVNITNFASLTADGHINRSQGTICEKCLQIVEVCKEGSSMVCNLCSATQNISKERNEARNQTEAAARKMPTFNIGDCVLLNIPKVDRAPGDFRNIICLIMDQKNGVNQVASKHGTIKG